MLNAQKWELRQLWLIKMFQNYSKINTLIHGIDSGVRIYTIIIW